MIIDPNWTREELSKAKGAYNKWLAGLHGSTGKEKVFTKQRCVNIGGRDLFCVQDSASIKPHPFLLFGGLALLLWGAR